MKKPSLYLIDIFPDLRAERFLLFKDIYIVVWDGKEQHI